MNKSRYVVWILFASFLGWGGGTGLFAQGGPRAEALRPAAAERVEEGEKAVSSEARPSSARTPPDEEATAEETAPEELKGEQQPAAEGAEAPSEGQESEAPPQEGKEAESPPVGAAPGTGPAGKEAETTSHQEKPPPREKEPEVPLQKETAAREEAPTLETPSQTSREAEKGLPLSVVPGRSRRSEGRAPSRPTPTETRQDRLKQARRQSELAVQRMALATAQKEQRHLRARWREVAPVERGQIAEADVQQRILQLAKQAADWEQQSEEAAAAGAGLRPIPKGDEELAAALAELAQVTADNARLAGQLAIALQQAVEMARQRRLNVRSESRISAALLSQAAAQLRQWQQAGASAWANWPTERRLEDLLPRLLLLLLATALAFTGDWLLRRYGPLALRDEGTRREPDAVPDCGLRIADCGTRSPLRNPKSEIRNCRGRRSVPLPPKRRWPRGCAPSFAAAG